MQDVTSEVARRWRHRSEDAREAQAALMAARDAATALYPVSVDFDPPFDLLVPRAGRGERQSGADVAAAITTHGSWQPSVQPSRRPSLTDAVVGSMGGADSRQNVLVGELSLQLCAGRAAGGWPAGRLLARGFCICRGRANHAALPPLHCPAADVGAGYGLLSLAAAAQGHRVHAFELGPASLEALEASLAHNGLEHLVQVHKEALGSLDQEGYTCILPRQPPSNAASSSGGGGRREGAADSSSGGSSSSGGGSSSSTAATAVDVEVQRGYGPAEVHAMPAEACQLMTRRSAGAWALPEGERVAALRVSGVWGGSVASCCRLWARKQAGFVFRWSCLLAVSQLCLPGCLLPAARLSQAWR